MLPREAARPALARDDRRGRGRTGIRQLVDRPVYVRLFGGAARAPRAGDGRHARHRALASRSTAPTSSPAGRRTGSRFRPAPNGSARASAPTAPRPPRTTSTTSGGRWGSAGSRSTAIPTGPSWPSPTPSATRETLNALVLDSRLSGRGESAWYPSLIETGVRAISIACRRSPDCSGNASKRLDRLVHFLRSRHKGVGPLIDVLSVAALRASGQLSADRPRREPSSSTGTLTRGRC